MGPDTGHQEEGTAIGRAALREDGTARGAERKPSHPKSRSRDSAQRCGTVRGEEINGGSGAPRILQQGGVIGVPGDAD